MRLARVERRPLQIPGRPPRWQRRWRRHRRAAAAVLAGVATFGIASAAAAPPPPTRAALVATRDLAPGARLRPGDAAPTSRAIDVLPSDAMAVDAEAAGRVLVVPVHAGEVLRARDLVASHLVAGLGPGLVATPVRLADGSATSLLAPGDVVDVLAATAPDVGAVGSAQVVAAGVRVLVAGVSTSTSEAVLGATGSSRDGGLLVVATTPEQALDLARAGAGSHLSVTLRPN